MTAKIIEKHLLPPHHKGRLSRSGGAAGISSILTGD